MQGHLSFQRFISESQYIGTMKLWMISLLLIVLGQAMAQAGMQKGGKHQDGQHQEVEHKNDHPSQSGSQKKKPPFGSFKKNKEHKHPKIAEPLNQKLRKNHKRAKKARLSMTETQRVLSAANSILGGLDVGPTVVVRTPQGSRLGVLLLYQEKAVAVAFLRRNGRLAKLHHSPLLPSAVQRPEFAMAIRQKLKQQLSAAALSGAIEVTPGYYRVLLTSDGVPIAALRLRKKNLEPKFRFVESPKPEKKPLQ